MRLRLGLVLIAAVCTYAALVPASGGAAGGCTWDWQRIHHRQKVSCRLAQIVVADYWGKDDPRAEAWSCLSKPPGYVAGSCRHGKKTFRFTPTY